MGNRDSVTAFGEFDALGRVKASTQATAGQSYSFQYQYNLAGGLTQIGYPSGRVVTYNHDEAGRISEVGGYASNITYTAHGAVAQMELGNQLWESAEYDPARLQVSEMRLGTAAQASDRWRLTNGYGASATNNGNVRSQTLTLAGWTAAQSFDYDSLNRIRSAGEGTSWTRTFDGDQYGNYWVSGWTGLSPGSFTPVSAEWYDARNRITGAPSADFDAAGNQTQLGGYHFEFDAENRLAASTINDVRTTYSYDGEGRRVKKVAGGNTTVFVYDAAGVK